MAGGKGWFKGCAIGCGAMLALVVLLGVGGGLMVKRAINSIEKTGDAIDALDEDFGRVRDFAPAADGSIAADRIEAFLAVRSATERERRATARIMERLDEDEHGGPFGIIRKVGAGLKALPRIKKLIDARTDALRDNGMGLGEYMYLYGAVYYCWLGRSPADGPDFRLKGEGDTGADIRHERLTRGLEYLNWGGRRWLANQLEEIERTGAGGGSWRDSVAAELAELSDDGYRLPWLDGLPDRTAASLEPFRGRLADSYDELNNAVEFMVEHRN